MFEMVLYMKEQQMPIEIYQIQNETVLCHMI